MVIMQAGIQLLSIACIVISFVGGKMLLDAGVITVGKLVAFYALSSLISMNMANLFMQCGAIVETNGIMKKISFVLEADEESTDGKELLERMYGLQKELIEAAKQANAYDFIMETPGGFDAPVDPGGSNFSGGQRQCIAIVRAIIRGSGYLLLDGQPAIWTL